MFFGGVIGDGLGGFVSDWLLRRTGSLTVARRNLVVFGMAGSLLCSIPILFTGDATIAALCLSGTFFFSELTIGPIWAIPLDVAPRYAGTASGLVNAGSAVAGIISPILFGVIIDATGNWTLPFAGSIGLLLVGAVATFWMKPQCTVDDAMAAAVSGYATS